MLHSNRRRLRRLLSVDTTEYRKGIDDSITGTFGTPSRDRIIEVTSNHFRVDDASLTTWGES